MSVSHSVLPGSFSINPRPELTARHNPARASDATMVRLPSYKELTASCGEMPPLQKTSRSNLFTAGLIHLPPLKVPTSPISPSSGHKILTEPLGQMKRRYYDDDDSDESPEGHRYLDLSLHCPHPPRGPRVGSPQSTDSAASSSSSRPGPWSPAPAHSLTSASAYNSHGHATLPSPGSGVAYDLTQAQPRLKFSHAKAGGRTKKQALSCYFCRERKIACGRPDEGNPDGTCNQCARRKIECRYPTVSHRGQHSRIKSAARKGIASSTSPRIPSRAGMTLVAQGMERGVVMGGNS